MRLYIYIRHAFQIVYLENDVPCITIWYTVTRYTYKYEVITLR